MRGPPAMLALALILALAGCGTAASTRATGLESLTATPAQSSAASSVLATPSRSVAPTVPATAPAPTATATATVARSDPAGTPSRPAATATPRPVAVAAGNVSGARDAAGTLLFIGEVVNTGAADVANIQVAVSLLDDAGRVVASGQAITIGLHILPAGRKTVWQARIPDAPARWAEERVEVQAGPVTASARRVAAAGLMVEGVATSPPADRLVGPTVAGRVRNGGDAPAKFVVLTIGGYDAAGKLTLVEVGTVDAAEIAPGESAPFHVPLPNTREAPATVEVYAKGVR